MLDKIGAFIDSCRDPLFLAVAVLVLFFIISSAGMLLGELGLWSETYILFPWMIAAAMLLYYSFFTGISLMVAKESGKTWGRAIYGLMGYGLLSGLYAWWLSGRSIYEADFYIAIYSVLLLAFFIFLAIGTSVKMVVLFANQRDPNRDKNNNNE